MNVDGVHSERRGRDRVAPDAVPGNRFLLIAGRTHNGTAGETVVSFSDEDEARRAFLNRRLQSAAPDNWARLASVDTCGSTRVLCWFGPAPDQLLPAQSAPDIHRIRTRKDGLMKRTTLSPPLADANMLEGYERADTRPPWPLRDTVPAGRDERTTARRYRRLAILVVVAAATVLVAARLSADGGLGPTAPEPAVQSSIPHPSAVVGYEVVAEQAMAFKPETLRTWETTDRLQQITVMAGTLSVDDDHGNHRDYRAGESFMAGWSPYTTSNGTTETVQVWIRHLRPGVEDAVSPARND